MILMWLLGKRKVRTAPEWMARAQELGVDINRNVPFEYEVQRRVMEAERHIRDGQLWWVALWSAIASVISAAGAWMAVYMGK